MKEKKTNWREHRCMFVIGCIDSNGAITAHAVREGRTHSPEESRGARFRWCIWSQEFCDVFGGTARMTEEEFFAVKDWLIKHQFADPERI